MKDNPFSLTNLRGRSFVVANIVLVFGLILISLNCVHPRDAFACGGQLGIGFPVSSLCNYSAGGSPLSSATKIDAADFPFLSPHGFLVDFAFYSGVLWAFWRIERGVSRLIKQSKATKPV